MSIPLSYEEFVLQLGSNFESSKGSFPSKYFFDLLDQLGFEKDEEKTLDSL